MNISAPKVRYEVNLNTIIVLVGFGSMAIGWGITWGQNTTDIKTLMEFRTEALVVLRQVDSLNFRMTAAEASGAAVTRGMSDLQSAVSQQSGDIKVVREILQRLERQSSPAAFTPMAASVE